MRTTMKLFKFVVAFGLIAVQAQAHDQVYQVQSSSCGWKNSRFAQSGFRAVVQGQVGLVTALHGVVGCGRVVALQEPELGNTYVQDLTLTKVSVTHDAAFYTSATLAQRPGQPLSPAGSSSRSGLKVIGYPQESKQQLDHPLEFFDNPRRTLSGQFASDAERKLAQRGSPSVDIEVLLVRGVLQSGYSGAPVLASTASVVGIANGGLAQGFAQINWVIPFEEIPWQPYDKNDPKIMRLVALDAASLFHSPWSGQSGPPQTGANITGKIYYNGRPAAYTTRAFGVIELVEVATWRALPIDYRYENTTSDFTILDVPPGKYTAFVRLEAGWPFDAESGGDYHARISGLNPDIVVAPQDSRLQVNLEVVQGIHLTRPVDNQQRRTTVSDPPESFYPSLYAPSAEIFEWDPVPGAAYYQVFILTVRGIGQPPLNVIEKRLTQPQFSPGLGVSPPGTEYMFRVEAHNAAGKLIGTFDNYYKNGSGGWLQFRVIPPPR